MGSNPAADTIHRPPVRRIPDAGPPGRGDPRAMAHDIAPMAVQSAPARRRRVPVAMFLLATGLQILLVAVGIVVARAAVTTARTPQGAAAWVVFLVSFPLLAIPAFAVLGSVSRLSQTPDDRHAPAARADDAPGRLGALRGVTGVPLRAGNDLRLLVDGRATFDAIFAAIDAAECEVVVQFYIIRADAVGLALRDRLVAAAGRGVRVHVLCDLVGSLLLGRRYSRALQAAGVEIRGIPGPHRALGRIGLNFRNHRKAVVVDGRTGFVGGYNVGREYVDGGASFDGWRDTHLAMRGPMAGQLRDLFAADWFAVTGRALEPMPEAPAVEGGRLGLVAGFGPTDRLERGSLLLCGLIGLARHRLWIATPYLVPHTDLLTALQLAALRGVDVRVLIPAPADKALVWYASRGYARMLQAGGIAVLEYLPGFMHQKVILIDDDLASIGTMNLDIRSALLNFEATALVEDEGFAAEVAAMLEADFARARAVADPPSRRVRALAPVARIFGPLL